MRKLGAESTMRKTCFSSLASCCKPQSQNKVVTFVLGIEDLTLVSELVTKREGVSRHCVMAYFVLWRDTFALSSSNVALSRKVWSTLPEPEGSKWSKDSSSQGHKPRSPHSMIEGPVLSQQMPWSSHSNLPQMRVQTSWESATLVIQLYSVTKSHLNLCHHMNCRISGFPVHHLPEFAQTYVH